MKHIYYYHLRLHWIIHSRGVIEAEHLPGEGGVRSLDDSVCEAKLALYSAPRVSSISTAPIRTLYLGTLFGTEFAVELVTILSNLRKVVHTILEKHFRYPQGT